MIPVLRLSKAQAEHTMLPQAERCGCSCCLSVRFMFASTQFGVLRIEVI